MVSKIEISHRTIIFTVLLLVGLWFLVQIRDILFLVFVSFILMSALRPLVDSLERVKIPRILAVLFIYGIVLGVFSAGIAQTVPTFITQSNKFIQVLPGVVERVLPYWHIDERVLAQQLSPIGENVIRITVGVFSNIVTTLSILVFTFYFLLARTHTDEFLSKFMGAEAAGRVIAVVGIIEKRLGAWVRGQVFLMFIVGALVYVGLAILRVEFALPLAIIAGLLEIVPVIGPVVSAIPAVLITLATSPFLALSVVALYIIVQQLENNLIVPLVMKKSVGLSPLVTILSLMIGARLAGLSGAILAVPVLLVLQESIGAFLAENMKRK
ncbi:AI-2E family transporter [Patescibacteria group bacterium]|nr:AI-2E family transporter [Patescibacteria group bacterium]MBU2544022.1 AI-2E family transporter [Patescibacteria group bacterium]